MIKVAGDMKLAQTRGLHLEGPQPFPEPGDLVASWTFRGKVYEPR